MIDPKFVYLAGVLNLAGIAGYAFDTLKGKTKPNRVTWLLWTVAPLIAFFAQLSEGVGIGAVLSLAIGLGPLLVLIATIMNKASYWKITTFDIICGSTSVLALVLWFLTGQGTIAIIFSIIADFMAGVPTLLKAYKFPHTESYNAFLAGIIAAGITLLSLRSITFASAVFPLYLLINGMLLFLLIRFPSLRIKTPAKRTV